MKTKLLLLLLACACLACDDTPVTPTIITVTPEPSPTPTPDLSCVVHRVRIHAELEHASKEIYAWSPGEIAILEASPLNNLDQILNPSCEYDRTATWRFLGSADCKPQGDSAGLVVRAVCDAPGFLRAEVDIDGVLGVADYDIIS